MYLISIGSWSSPREASSWVLLVVSIPVHLVWVVEDSHQSYSPIPGHFVGIMQLHVMLRARGWKHSSECPAQLRMHNRVLVVC